MRGSIRKIQRYASELDYTAGDWEFSVLKNVLRVQCECIFDEPCLSYDRVCLIKPKAAKAEVQQCLRAALGMWAGECQTAVRASYRKGSCGRGDVVVVAADAAEHFVAQVWFHFQVDGLVLSLVSQWLQVGSNEFHVTDNVICVHTACITRECV